MALMFLGKSLQDPAPSAHTLRLVNNFPSYISQVLLKSAASMFFLL